MKKGAEQESRDLGHRFALFVFYHEFEVDVAVEEEMNWFVPFTVELLVSVTIPPVLVKLSVV